MKALKYAGAVVSVLLALGTLPAMYLIALGLSTGAVVDTDRTHFTLKLSAYFAEVLLLFFIAWRLARSARRSST